MLLFSRFLSTSSWLQRVRSQVESARIHSRWPLHINLQALQTGQWGSGWSRAGHSRLPPLLDYAEHGRETVSMRGCKEQKQALPARNLMRDDEPQPGQTAEH